MEIKAELVGEEFNGLNAKLFYKPGGLTTILFNGRSDEWAAISFDTGDEIGSLNFYKIADIVKTHEGVTIAEALTLVRAAQIDMGKKA